MIVIHLSNEDSFKDGGIYFYIRNLLYYQKQIGINSFWITCRNNNVKVKKSEILKSISNLKPDIIHIHGIWALPTFMINDLLKITKNIIVAPHGMLHKNALKQSKIKKKLALLFYEKKNIEKTSFIHVLNKSEGKDVKKIFKKKTFRIISTGISIPTSSKAIYSHSWLDKIKKQDKILLFLGRLENQKGIRELLEIWIESREEAKKYGWWLLVVGFGSYSDKVNESSLNPSNRIIFNGKAFGKEKESIFRISDAYILPSKWEGLPITVLEALSNKLVCLLTKECNLEKLKKLKSSIEINIDKKKMKKTIIKLFKLTNSELKKRSTIGHKYVKNEHDWLNIAKQSEAYYRDLLSKEN
ncbi:glycosyltransferase [Prochlorococcus marinus XMU1410]|uniref:glycosyltransferase n=1 Tax=Prochlorococcus marinus TaxID=1219 RepID=UPI001ADBA9EF|nr:glycosyltransferase [Prochlorococcus marinus]MBO8242372.1 glycosyltransferase [Prochlorococcus marinus XMU1410]MBW3053520.1 hypothetical protein [Prochlorococcus marinus str. MU1410]